MIIYTGRFQPMHNGHLSLIKQLKKQYPNETICIAVIKDTPLDTKTDFDHAADGMLSRERNPFDTQVTLTLIDRVLKAENLDNVLVTLMPRASVATWPIITALFDCERTWVFTQNQISPDAWEDQKATFYQSMGDNVVRVPIQKTIAGTLIRQAIKLHDYDSLATMVPQQVLQYIVENKI